MNSLDRYILRQTAIPLVFVLVVTTILVWMTQVLQRVEILIDYGQSFGVFAFLMLLIIPSLMAIIIPFATFGACVFVLHRMHSDSEIAVIFAAGVSRWRLSAPILAIATLGAAATLYVNVDLMPRCYRIMKQAVADIRADIASSVVRSGEFSDFGDGFTIYVDNALPGGRFEGLLIHDHREPGDEKTYLAERALITETDVGPLLQLKNGTLQQKNAAGDVEFIAFIDSVVNISDFRDGDGQLVLELTERYPHELLNPDMSRPYDRANAGKLIAEGHARYAAPLHAFAYVLIGLVAMIGGAYSRRGYILRIAIAGVAVFSTRIFAYVAQGLAE
ncbi:MAG: LptF/LptG family permease, partial [Pseudomonadota bacterium]